MGTHTYGQTLKLEVARDLLNGEIATRSEMLETAKNQVPPDSDAVARIRSEMLALGGEIDALDVRDEARLDAVIASHAKEPAAH